MSATKLIFVCVAFLILAATITVTGEPCEDIPSWANECANLKKNFGDRICISRNFHMRRIARKKCKGSCGLCPRDGGRRRAQAPPIKCSRTIYGCCWDRITPAAGPRDQGCPPCVNRHNWVCRRFRWMCGRNTANSDYIKLNCPISCGFCSPGTYIATGNEESVQTILARMMWKEYRERKSRRG